MATTQPEELPSRPGNPAVPTTLTPAGLRPPLKDWLRCATIVLIALNILMFLIMVLQGVSVFEPTAESVLK